MTTVTLLKLLKLLLRDKVFAGLGLNDLWIFENGNKEGHSVQNSRGN
jgi:hypothetical protein